MVEIAADILRAMIIGAIFVYLRTMRGRESPRLRKAWIFFLIGFGLLFLGGLLNLAEHFPSLQRHLTFGRRQYADFIEQVFGSLLGLLFVGIGFWQWLPAILALRAEQQALRKSQHLLQEQVAALTEERNRLKRIVECELGYAAREDASGEGGKTAPTAS
jgi:hypothetical protein